MVFEPNLKLMVLTKENVAAQAFAEHIEGLHMPPCVNEKLADWLATWNSKRTGVLLVILTGFAMDH